MAQCSGCGKKGLFLKLNARRLCEECAQKAQDANGFGEIRISVDGVSKASNKTDLGHADEVSICQYFIDRLVERGKDIEMFKIEHRSSDYTSLVYDERNDFLRVKMTENTAWLSIALSDEDCIKYADDPLFYDQKNKNQRHWKSYFESIEQLPIFVDMAYNACFTVGLGSARAVKDQERIVADYLYDLFVSCGAEEDRMYYITYSDEFELTYNTANMGIQFKAYAKKPGGYLRMDYDMQRIIGWDDIKYPFSELTDLDCLKDEIIPRKIDYGRKAEQNNPDRLPRYQRLFT